MENENNKLEFIKADDNTIINVKLIRWVKQMNECMEVCTKMESCNAGRNTMSICKSTSPKSYDILNKYFE